MPKSPWHIWDSLNYLVSYNEYFMTKGQRERIMQGLFSARHWKIRKSNPKKTLCQCQGRTFLKTWKVNKLAQSHATFSEGTKESDYGPFQMLEQEPQVSVYCKEFKFYRQYTVVLRLVLGNLDWLKSILSNETHWIISPSIILNS